MPINPNISFFAQQPPEVQIAAARALIGDGVVNAANLNRVMGELVTNDDFARQAVDRLSRMQQDAPMVLDPGDGGNQAPLSAPPVRNDAPVPERVPIPQRRGTPEQASPPPNTPNTPNTPNGSNDDGRDASMLDVIGAAFGLNRGSSDDTNEGSRESDSDEDGLPLVLPAARPPRQNGTSNSPSLPPSSPDAALPPPSANALRPDAVAEPDAPTGSASHESVGYMQQLHMLSSGDRATAESLVLEQTGRTLADIERLLGTSFDDVARLPPPIPETISMSDATSGPTFRVTSEGDAFTEQMRSFLRESGLEPDEIDGVLRTLGRRGAGSAIR